MANFIHPLGCSQDLELGMRLFLNRAWFAVSPESDTISPYNLIILYCLYIRVGSLRDTSVVNSMTTFAEAAREILAFLDSYDYDKFMFQELDVILELISGMHPLYLLNLTKSQAINRTLRFPLLNFYKYLSIFLSEIEDREETEPNSSGYEDEEEKENSGSSSTELSPLRKMEPRDILTDITMRTLSQGTQLCYMEGSSPILLGSPIHFEERLLLPQQEDQEDVAELIFQLKSLFN